MMEISDYAIIIGFTTILTTASTTVMIFKSKQSLESVICAKIEKIHERINKVAIKIGVLENEHKSKCAIN